MRNHRKNPWNATRTAAFSLVVPALLFTACEEAGEYADGDVTSDNWSASTPHVQQVSNEVAQEREDARERAAERREQRREDDSHSAAWASGEDVTFPGADGADAIRLERMGSPEVRANEPFTYEMRVTNVSEFPVYGVTVHEMLPDGVHVASAHGANSQQNGSASGSESYEIGRLDPGESSTVTVEGVAQTEGDLHMCLGVKFDQAVCTTLRVVKPELQVVQNVPEQPVYVCDDPEFTFVVTNVGSGVTENAFIETSLPEGLTFDGNNTVKIDAGRLEAGQSFEKTLTLQAENGGEFTTVAKASTGKLTVQSPEQKFRLLRPELALQLDGPSVEFVDRPITYQLHVQNVSDDPAIDTVVRFPSTEGMDELSVSSQLFDENENAIMIGDLAAGESRTFNLTFTRDEPGELAFAAVAEAYCTETVRQDLLTQVKGIPAVRLEVIDLTDPVAIGETAVYAIRVKNQGSARDLNVQLTATLPPQMTFQNAQGDSEITADGQTLTFAPLSSLAPGETATWEVHATVNAAGKARLRLELTSDATTRPVIEEEPTNLFDNREAGNRDAASRGENRDAENPAADDQADGS